MLSAAKMFAVLSLIGGIVLAVLAVAVLSAFPAALSAPVYAVPVMGFFAGLGALLLIVIPVLAAGFRFCDRRRGGGFYNIIAEKLGGARLARRGLVQSLDPVSMARIVALIAGIVTTTHIHRDGALRCAPQRRYWGSCDLRPWGIGDCFCHDHRVCDFIIVVVVYNFLARKIGGIRVNIKANVLKRVEPVPFAKIYGIFTTIFGLFYGIIFSLVFILASTVPTSSPYMHAFGAIGAFSIVVFPVLGFIFGFAYAAICALVYNWIASKIDGIRLYFS